MTTREARGGIGISEMSEQNVMRLGGLGEFEMSD